jgi:hypothetical protein
MLLLTSTLTESLKLLGLTFYFAFFPCLRLLTHIACCLYEQRSVDGNVGDVEAIKLFDSGWIFGSD